MTGAKYTARPPAVADRIFQNFGRTHIAVALYENNATLRRMQRPRAGYLPRHRTGSAKTCMIF